MAMKATEDFGKTIENYLRKRAFNNVLFAKKLENPDKNMEDCVTYILNTVQKSGSNGFSDDEIYNMAFHYYSEKSITVGSRPSATIVSNHQVKLSEEEIAEAKRKAYNEVITEEKSKLRGNDKKHKKVEPKKDDDNVKTLF